MDQVGDCEGGIPPGREGIRGGGLRGQRRLRKEHRCMLLQVMGILTVRLIVDGRLSHRHDIIFNDAGQDYMEGPPLTGPRMRCSKGQ